MRRYPSRNKYKTKISDVEISAGRTLGEDLVVTIFRTDQAEIERKKKSSQMKRSTNDSYFVRKGSPSAKRAIRALLSLSSPMKP